MSRATLRLLRCFVFILLVIGAGHSNAQDLEPRRWTALPAGINVVGAGAIASHGDIFFDPVMIIEDAEVDGRVVAASYVRSFKIGNKLGRVDAVVPWMNMHWSGLLDGVPASANRTGLGDPIIRASVLLAGAPASGGSLIDGKKSNTVVGAAIAVSLPLGEYNSENLLNLGNNRYFVRPQFGVLHTRGKWSYELTGSTFIFSDNDDFYGGNKLQQDPLYAVQGHIIRVFDKPGYWVALSTGYGWKGDTVVDGVRSYNSQQRWLWSAAFGIPLGEKQGMKFAYIRDETQTDLGADIDSLVMAWSYVF